MFTTLGAQVHLDEDCCQVQLDCDGIWITNNIPHLKSAIKLSESLLEVIRLFHFLDTSIQCGEVDT